MNDKKEKIKKLLYIPLFLKILLTLVVTVLLIWIFVTGRNQSIIAYFVYPLSAYTLVVISVTMPTTIKNTKKYLNEHEKTSFYVNKSYERTIFFLQMGLIVNLLYAAFKMSTAVYYSSAWLGAIAIYYSILVIIKYYLLRREKMYIQFDQEDEAYIKRWNSYRVTGFMLLLLSASILGLAIQMVLNGESYEYGEIVVIASAAYTFYRLTLAIVNAVQNSHSKNAIISAVKYVNLSTAFIAILALQTALLAAYALDDNFVTLMNLFTSIAVCSTIIIFAIRMIKISNKKLNTIS